MQLDHIVINASNQKASALWYGVLLPMLGFELTGDLVWGNKAGIYIDLRQANESDLPYHRHGPGVNHIGFTAPTRKAVDAIRHQMALQGFEVPEVQILKGGYCLFMKDDDGFRVEITCYS
ncbi:MAG: VOC family protein [Proteobacteria bacterium]|nr:VOC family protein [Pseudomonadota bacterium]